MKRLSIIVPVYQVEKYIRACFESIFKQGLDDADFEVIIVNDGTAVCQLGATGWSHTFDDPSIQSETDDYGMQTAVGVGKRVAEVAKVIKSSGLQNITYQYNQQIGKR